jgi:hypothetical protein
VPTVARTRPVTQVVISEVFMNSLFLGWNRAAKVPLAPKYGLKRHTGLRAQTKTIRFAYRPGSIRVSTS